MVVLLLIDAMREDYISEENTPFLNSCRKDGLHYKRVIPSFGYCERTEILTGLKPNESGYFTAIGYDPVGSPYRKLPYLKYLSFLELNLIKARRFIGNRLYNYVYKYFRGMCSRLIRKYPNSGFRDYKIPISLLSEFNLTEDRVDHRDSSAFSKPSILKLLEDNNKSYFYDSFTALNMEPNGTDDNRLAMSLERATTTRDNLHLIYISILDTIGHKFGPDSDEMNEALQNIDKKLCNYVTSFNRIVPDATYIFLGDHGMEPVKQRFDAESELMNLVESSKLKLKEDFIYFLDSTMMRVWFKSRKAEENLLNRLTSSEIFLKFGIFVDENLANRYQIPWKDRRYGDLIWQAKLGVLIYPDFFHKGRDPHKGMHGYDVSSLASQGTCIIAGNNVKQSTKHSIPLCGVFGLLKTELNL